MMSYLDTFFTQTSVVSALCTTPTSLLTLVVVAGERDKYCRLMTYNDTHMMLAVSQPSFTALAPGFGIRRINMLDQKVGSFVALHREPIRDLAFNPVRRDQLLSGGQDRCVTNLLSIIRKIIGGQRKRGVHHQINIFLTRNKFSQSNPSFSCLGCCFSLDPSASCCLLSRVSPCCWASGCSCDPPWASWPLSPFSPPSRFP